MPETRRDPEVILHALAEDDSVGVVHAIGEDVGRFEAAERNAIRHLGKERVGHASILRSRLSAPPAIRFTGRG
jgi:hypothetical protein